MTEPFTIMLWGITEESIAQWLGAGSDDDPGELRGMAASPGVAEGPARVIASPAQIGEVRDGEILVAPLTAPSWAPIFGKIRATVTDIGGIMSHAAIVCREYGLPAVTGTASATKRIRTGQRIRVDGNTGTVTIIDETASRTHEPNSVAEGLRVEHQLVAAVQCGKPGDVLGREREVEHRDVLAQPLRVLRLRHRHQPELDVPPQQDLGGGAPVPLRQLADTGSERSSAPRPSGDHDWTTMPCWAAKARPFSCTTCGLICSWLTSGSHPGLVDHPLQVRRA